MHIYLVLWLRGNLVIVALNERTNRKRMNDLNEILINMSECMIFLLDNWPGAVLVSSSGCNPEQEIQNTAGKRANMVAACITCGTCESLMDIVKTLTTSLHAANLLFFFLSVHCF